jgi:hypothetical protein
MDQNKFGPRGRMKNGFIGKLAVLMLASVVGVMAGAAILGAFTTSAMAQTTNPGTGPSEQPDAPMEIGAPQQGPDAQPPAQPSAQAPDMQPSDAQAGDQPNNAQPDNSQPNAQPDNGQPSDAQPTEAQPGGPTGEAPATTDKGVARLSLIHGDVSTQRGDSGDWSAAALNQPLMGGDKVSTGDSARAELQLDFANTLRVGPNSKANIANFTKKNIQIQLSQGIATYTVSKDSEAEPEIDTPNVSVHPAHHDGVFRVEIHPDGDTIVIVRQGEAQIATPQGSTEIHAGEMATVRGDADNAQYKISPAPDRDDWDRWNSDRDHLIRNANSWHHTNRYYTGTQDLDAYGRWQNVPDYGDVWVPNESDGWAPYRDGSWTYEPYYGWTWVGYEPWGWAPYHYGRWLSYGNSWAWWPGPVGSWYRPFWSPAYVSFWGWGGGFGFGFGFGGWGGFGWLPLGPGDWFHPWWGGYGGRFGWAGRGWGYGGYGGFAPLHAGARFSNVAGIHDAHIGGALSVVNAGHFGAGRVTAAAATRAQIGGARMMAGNLPVVPSRASLSASGRAAAPSTVRNGGPSRFYGSSNAGAHSESFAHETSNLRQSMAANHVGGIPAGGRSGGDFSARGASGTMSRPSAGISNRDSSFGNRGTQSGMNGGPRSFTPPNNSNRSTATERSNSGLGNSESRGANQGASGNRDGFRPFTPPSNSSASRGESGASADRAGNGGYWNRTGSGESSSRGYSDGFGRGSASSSRPQLDMHQPIVRGPSYGGSRGSYGGGYGGYHAPSYGGSRPSYGGGHSAPSYHAPSGGGHSSGGGGGHAGGGGHGGGGGHH